MNNLLILTEEYKNNPNIKTQKAIADFYVKDYENREYNQTYLLHFFKEDQLENDIKWHYLFEGDQLFWKKIFLISEEKNAKNFLTQLTNQEDTILSLRLAVNMCDICSSRVEDIKGLSQEVEQIWFKVFEQFPDFQSKLKQKQLEKEERITQYLNSLCLLTLEKPETIKTLEIHIPMLLEMKKPIDFDTFVNSAEYKNFINTRIDSFNNFELNAYINCPECHNITMSIDNNMTIFTLKLNKETNLEKLKSELLGQLSDGLGENLTQQPITIGEDNYYFHFDINNASDFKEIQHSQKIKIK